MLKNSKMNFLKTMKTDKFTFHTQVVRNYHSTMTDLISKFRKGDAIDDLELRELLGHYLQLAKLLYAEGERFHHAWRDANDQVIRLMDMQNARRNNN